MSSVAGPVPPTPFRHATALWVLLFACESVNGALREAFLTPVVGPVVARQVGLATGTVLVLAIATLFHAWLGARTRRAQLQVGALWGVLTLAAEIALAWKLGLSPGAFLADYDATRGGVMAFGLLVLLLAPMVGAWVGDRRSRLA